MAAYLQPSDIIDWPNPTILDLAQRIARNHATPIAQACLSGSGTKFIIVLTIK